MLVLAITRSICYLLLQKFYKIKAGSWTSGGLLVDFKKFILMQCNDVTGISCQATSSQSPPEVYHKSSNMKLFVSGQKLKNDEYKHF